MKAKQYEYVLECKDNITYFVLSPLSDLKDVVKQVTSSQFVAFENSTPVTWTTSTGRKLKSTHSCIKTEHILAVHICEER